MGTDGSPGPCISRVLITGGNSGIGLATTLRFARRGARVAVLARGEVGLAAVREQTRAVGAECETFAVDVSDRTALEQEVDAAVEALGGLDLAIVNAGASTYGRFVETSAEDFDRVVAVTFTGAVNTVRAVLPHLARSCGSLVVVGSVAADVPLPLMSAYTGAKHALKGFVEALRIELRAGRSPVGVSLVEPGPIDTPFWLNVATQAGRLPPRIPLVYGAEEVAIAIEHCASRRPARIAVGGGWAAARLAYRALRPLVQPLMARGTRGFERIGREGSGRAAIWNPSGTGEQRAGRLRRPSLLVRGRQMTGARRGARIGAPRRQRL
jgi:short-subunit dehydrogenase